MTNTPLLSVALAALALVSMLSLATWVASVVRRETGAGKSLLIDALGLATGARAEVMLALGLAWALRLAVYITRRNWGHGEDRRYRAIRARNEPNFALKSLVLVFALQALLARWPNGCGRGAP